MQISFDALQQASGRFYRTRMAKSIQQARIYCERTAFLSHSHGIMNTQRDRKFSFAERDVTFTLIERTQQSQKN